AQLVADQLDDALEVERACDALLNAVDDRELARALLELCRAVGDLALQVFGKASVGERDGGLAREHREQVTIAVVKAAERAVDVDVDVTQQVALHAKRNDQAAA